MSSAFMPALLEASLGGRARGGEHDDRLGADRRDGSDAGPRGHAVGTHPGVGCDDRSGRTVDDARRVPCVVHVIDVVDLRVHGQRHLVVGLALLGEGRAKLGESLEGAPGSWVLVVIEERPTPRGRRRG